MINRDLMAEVFTRIEWIQGDANFAQRQAWLEQIKDLLREIVASDCPSPFPENMYQYHMWLMAHDLLRDLE